MMSEALGVVREKSVLKWVAIVTACGLGACGGGGGSSSSGGPSVTSALTGVPMYGQTLQLTVSGSGVDQGLTVTATGCGNVAVDSTHSSSTAAFYQCTVSAVGSGQWTVARTADQSTLATAAFTVAAPQVTLNYDNGASVSGSLVLTLDPDKVPLTVNNFLSYVNAGFYGGTVFHRVVPGFVVQGGGYTAPLTATTQNLKATSPPIALEVGKGLSNLQWTVAMARTVDTSSATSQFFINLVDNSGSLDPGLTAGYAVFGTVTGNTQGVTDIAASPCTALPQFLASGECTPEPNVQIVSAVQTR